MAPWKTVSGLLAIVWLAVLAALTLTPQPLSPLDADLSRLSACLICGDRGTSDALLNLLVLAPLGLLLNERGWRPRRVAWAALALSAAIEITQHFIPGRYSNLGDVVWDSTGAWMAAYVWSLRTHWLPGSARDAARLRKLAVLAPSLVTFGFGWLMVPDWPAEPYWGQWTPDLGFMEQYHGTVLGARLDSIDLPSWRLPARDHARDLLQRDWTLHATIVKGPPPTALAPIVNIYDEKPEEVTMLGAVGQDLVYRERARARRFRFDDPALWFPGVLARAATGDTVQVGVARRGPTRCLMFNGSTSCPTYTPGRAWALLLPFESWSGRQRTMLDTAWMFLLLLPAGFWSERRRDVAVSVGVAGLLMSFVVAATRITLPSFAEVAGAALGSVVGYTLRLVSRTAQTDPDGSDHARGVANPATVD